MKTFFFKILLTGLALFLLATNVSAQDVETTASSDMEAASIVKSGDIAPDFTVQMLDGSSFRLSEAKGKVVLLNFWATWCPPCMVEFKEIPEKIIKRFEGEKDFVFIPVSREETFATVQKKMIELKEKGIDFPVGLDPDRKVYDLYAKSFIPRNYLIDRDGKVITATIGFNPTVFEDMIEKIAELIK